MNIIISIIRGFKRYFSEALKFVLVPTYVYIMMIVERERDREKGDEKKINCWI